MKRSRRVEDALQGRCGDGPAVPRHRRSWPARSAQPV